MWKNNTVQEVERIESSLKQKYGVDIVNRQYIPTPWFEITFSKEQWRSLDVFSNSAEMQHFLDDCRIRSFMSTREKYRGNIMGNVPNVNIISSYCMRFNGLLSMLEPFIILLSRKGMLQRNDI